MFREVAGEIKVWLESYSTHTHPKTDKMPWLTWKESSENVINLLITHESRSWH